MATIFAAAPLPRAPIMEAVLDHAARGGAVMGVCNGFQILLETGLLPGVLVENAGLKYVCRKTCVEVVSGTASPFTDGLGTGQRMIIPVAHNERNYFASDEDLQRLEDNGQIAFRYADSDIVGPSNPNGAARDIAGIVSPNGRVMGMMPHPERAISPEQGSADGATLLTACLEALSA